MNVAVHVINSSDVLKHNFLYKSIYGQDNFKRISHEIIFFATKQIPLYMVSNLCHITKINQNRRSEKMKMSLVQTRI